MQGGLHPELKIDWHERMLRGIKDRFPKIHLHCYSASEIIAIAEYSSLSIHDTISKLRDAGLDSIPGGGAEILDDEVRHRIARLKCLTNDWLNVHRTAHQLGMRTTATMMFGGGERNRVPRRGRTQLPNGRRTPPHHPRRRIQAGAEGHAVSDVFPELRSLRGLLTREVYL